MITSWPITDQLAALLTLDWGGVPPCPGCGDTATLLWVIDYDTSEVAVSCFKPACRPRRKDHHGEGQEAVR